MLMTSSFLGYYVIIQWLFNSYLKSNSKYTISISILYVTVKYVLEMNKHFLTVYLLKPIYLTTKYITIQYQ